MDKYTRGQLYLDKAGPVTNTHTHTNRHIILSLIMPKTLSPFSFVGLYKATGSMATWNAYFVRPHQK